MQPTSFFIFITLLSSVTMRYYMNIYKVSFNDFTALFSSQLKFFNNTPPLSLNSNLNLNTWDIEKFHEIGAVQFNISFSQDECLDIIEAVKSSRPFNEKIFISQSEYESDPMIARNANPRQKDHKSSGSNFLEDNINDSFIIEHPVLIQKIEQLIGKNHLKLFLLFAPKVIVI